MALKSPKIFRQTGTIALNETKINMITDDFINNSSTHKVKIEEQERTSDGIRHSAKDSGKKVVQDLIMPVSAGNANNRNINLGIHSKNQTNTVQTSTLQALQPKPF